MPRIEVTEDNGDEFDWSSVTRTYADDTDELLQELYVFDDGTTQQLDYEDSVLRSDFRTDYAEDSGGEVYPWQELTLLYDENGALIGKNVWGDNNIIFFNEFVDGVLDTKRMLNGDRLDGLESDYRWEFKVFTYDTSGEITHVSTRYEDISIEATYVDGILRETDLTGGFISSELWYETTTYDEAGVILSKDSRYNDGSFVERVYSDGEIRSISEFGIEEDGKYIDLRVRIYDADGNVVSNLTEYFGGDIISVQSINGTVASVTYDTADGEDGTYFNWHSGSKQYDEAGILISSDILYDTGINEQKTFEDGVLRTRIRTDDTETLNLDALNWDQIEFSYDAAGTVESKVKVFDDGDVVVVLYEDGQKTSNLEYDGDGDKTWVAKETQFDAMGQIASSITYASLDDVPDEYGLDDILMF